LMGEQKVGFWGGGVVWVGGGGCWAKGSNGKRGEESVVTILRHQGGKGGGGGMLGRRTGLWYGGLIAYDVEKKRIEEIEREM